MEVDETIDEYGEREDFAEVTNISIVHVPLLEPNVDICFTPLR